MAPAKLGCFLTAMHRAEDTHTEPPASLISRLLFRLPFDVGRRVRAGGETLRFARWSAGREGRQNLNRLRSLAGLYEGRRAFVMGNGPSLLQHDLNQLADEVTIVSNAHFLIWDQLDYVPTFLTVEDRLVAEDRSSELRALKDIRRVFPHEFRPLLGPATESTVYVHMPRDYRPFPKFSHHLDRRCFWGGTVSYMNLQLAAYLGCNPIVLIGFDHSYQIPADAHIDNKVIRSTTDDPNHIHPSYFGPGYRWHDPDVARMETAYEFALQALKRKGVSVLNATAGGHLEVFERVPFKSLF